MTLHLRLLALGAVALISSLARAGDEPPPPHPRVPPPEAIAACKGKAVGASVSFTGRRGETVTGTCESINGVLAARPEGMPPPPGPSAPSR